MKKLLISLFIGFVGIISFCNAEFIGSFTCNTPGTTCGTIQAPSDCVDSFSVYFDGGGQPFRVKTNAGTHASVQFYSGVMTSDCTYIEITGSPSFVSATYPVIVNYGTDPIGSCSCPECPTCPEFNTGEILSGYILESEIDTNYCVENGYCPNECGSGSDMSGDLQYSNIYINSILHPGTQNIFVDIPDYITRDYTTTGDDFNIYIGSGYDVDYINSIIDINSYRPDSEDFTNVFVSGLTLIFPYIFIFLLIVFIWKFVKRVFK